MNLRGDVAELAQTSVRLPFLLLVQDLLLIARMTRTESRLARPHRLAARLRAAVAAAAREAVMERWAWASTWGLGKAKEAVRYLGCDPHPDIPWTKEKPPRWSNGRAARSSRR